MVSIPRYQAQGYRAIHAVLGWLFAVFILILSALLWPNTGASASTPAPARPEMPPMRIVVVRSAAQGCEPNCAEWISAEGKIVPGTAALFSRVVRSLGAKKLPILISSPGGAVEDALAMGRLIRTRQLDVAVARSLMLPCGLKDGTCIYKPGAEQVANPTGAMSFCNSACVLILAAGTNRYVDNYTLVGVHQMYAQQTIIRLTGKHRVVTTRTIPSPQSLYDRVAAYYRQMGIGSEIMPLLRSAPPTSVHRLTPGELLVTNLVTEPSNGQWLIERINRRAFWAVQTKPASTTQTAPAGSATAKTPLATASAPAPLSASSTEPPSGAATKPSWAHTTTDPSSKPSNEGASVGSAGMTIHAMADPREDRTLAGSVTWRAGWKEDDPGPAKRPEITADVDFAKVRMSMTMTLFRSTEASAAQPFIMQLRFASGGDLSFVVTSVQMPLILRGRGDMGVAIPGKLLDTAPNAFTLELDPETDQERQSGRMFLPKAWFSIPLHLDNGQSADIAFEVGERGQNLMNQSIRHPALITNR